MGRVNTFFLICYNEVVLLFSGGTSKQMDIIRYEKDMYEPLRMHMEACGFTVFAEAKACDLVGKKEDQLLVVEMKRHLSFDLLEQAIERQSYADLVYVAIPKTGSFKLDKGFRSKLRVLSRLGLGLLLVSQTNGHSFVEVALDPKPDSAPRSNKRKRNSLENEIAGRRIDLNIGGSRGVPLMTAYREASLFLVFLLDSHGPATPKQLRSLGGDSKKTGSTLRSNFYHWFSRNEDGSYQASDQGREALLTYEPLTRTFLQKTQQEEE